jgi:hypothetical protein
MSTKEKIFLSSSKHYLSQKFWRFLRNILPSVTLWNIDYPKLVPPTNSGYLYGILLITKK